MFNRFWLSIGFLLTLVFLSAPVYAATSLTTTFGVTLTINASCALTSASSINFGSMSYITSNLDVNGSVVVQCTLATPYTLALSAGNSGDAAARTMVTTTTPVTTVSYSLFRDSSRTLNWGTATSDLLSSVGTGTSQTFPVYGRVPPQNAAQGAYADTITVTLTY